MEKLLSLSEYVSKIQDYVHESHNHEKGLKLIFNYTEFLNQRLELSMFVPADDKGNVIEKPSYKLEDYSEEEIGLGYMECDIEIYEKATERVLFEGFEVTESVYDNTGQSLFVGWEPYNAAIFIKLKGEDWKLDDYKTIEDLLLSGYEIELTESALKMIGKEQDMEKLVIIGIGFGVFMILLLLACFFRQDADTLAEENYKLQEENKYLKKLLKNRNEQKL